jgi:hypothetical protein
MTAGRNLIALRDQIFDDDMEIWESGAEHTVDDHKTFDATHRGREIALAETFAAHITNPELRARFLVTQPIPSG